MCGTLQAGAANAFSATSAFTVAAGATLGLNNFNQTIGSLAGDGNVTLGSATLTTGGDNTSTTFAGGISGTGGLVKTGSGIMVLTGTNSYTGGTTINGFGVLQLGDIDTTGKIVGGVTNNALFFVVNADTSDITTITNNGATSFLNSSSASSAAITNNIGGLLSFADTSTAGNATITTNNFALTQFTGNATGGTAQFITNAGGTVDFSGTSGPAGANQVTAGSIEGAGTYFLGANQLTVGGNNLTTTVTGTIEDGGSFGGTGASVVKVGAGTLTLSGINTYSGGTTINGGTLAVAADNNLGAQCGGAGLRRRHAAIPVGFHHQPHGNAECGRRHVRHQRQQRDACRHDRRHRRPDQAGPRHDDAVGHQQLSGRYGGQRRHAAGRSHECVLAVQRIHDRVRRDAQSRKL